MAAMALRGLLLFEFGTVACAAAATRSFALAAGYDTLELEANMDKAFLEVDWSLIHDVPAGEEPYLEVEAPSTVTIASSLKAGDANATAVLRLDFQDCHGHVVRSGSVRATAIVSGVASLLLVAREPHAHLAAVAAIAVPSLAIMAHAHRGDEATCGQDTKLILHLQENQWGELEQCGGCRPEDSRAGRRFRWRPACDVEAAEAALEAAATTCGEPADCDAIPALGSLGCEVSGWCPGLATPPAVCSLPASVSSTCIHRWFSSRFDNSSAAAKNLFDKIIQCTQWMAPVEGRPYTTGKGDSLVAPACWGGEGDGDGAEGRSSWGAFSPGGEAASDAVPKEWTEELGKAAAEAWLLHGQHEHASVASFARFSLDLMRFGAPPGLLAAASAAGGDEVRHARAAFKLAATLSGRADARVEVSPFPLGDAVPLAASLVVLARRTVEEGCRGESAAVARLSRALGAVAAESPARQVLQELLEEEARHAALAWSTVLWATGQNAGPSWVPPPAAAEAARRTSSKTELLLLRWAGRVPVAEAEEIARLVDLHWVGPWVTAASRQAPLPFVSVPIDGYGGVPEVLTAVEAAAQRVAHLLTTGDSAGQWSV